MEFNNILVENLKKIKGFFPEVEAVLPLTLYSIDLLSSRIVKVNAASS